MSISKYFGVLSIYFSVFCFAQENDKDLYYLSQHPEAPKNWSFDPYRQWTFQHMSEFLNTAIVSKQNSISLALVTSKQKININDIYFNSDKNEKTSVTQWLKKDDTDGFIVLHNNKVLYEQYFHDMKPYTKHQMFSVTKSFVGVVAVILSEEKKIDLTKTVDYYAPEFKGTGYQDVTLQDLLNMNVGLKYTEDYTNPASDFFKEAPGTSGCAYPSCSIRNYLVTLMPNKIAHSMFRYATVNADVLSWVLEKVTGQKIQDLISEKIWSKIGADTDAYMILDSYGVAWAGAGLNATLRDCARFGYVMLTNGKINRKSVISKNVIDEIRKNGDKKAFSFSEAAVAFQGFAYKNYWWLTNDDHGTYIALGLYGQWIYVDPYAHVVIVKQSSTKDDPDTDNSAIDSYRAMRAIAVFVSKHNINDK